MTSFVCEDTISINSTKHRYKTYNVIDVQPLTAELGNITKSLPTMYPRSIRGSLRKCRVFR